MRPLSFRSNDVVRSIGIVCRRTAGHPEGFKTFANVIRSVVTGYFDAPVRVEGQSAVRRR
ncbi:MAG: hypothetical protein QNJ44_04610 [Rhodobacter sp.]|nr:hypothetical protein [Rhodobacter sp.]